MFVVLLIPLRTVTSVWRGNEKGIMRHPTICILEYYTKNILFITRKHTNSCYIFINTDVVGVFFNFI